MALNVVAKSKKATFLAWSCIHVPVQDKAGIEWLCTEIADRKPDYVIDLGDLWDADAASRWPNEHRWDLLDEYEESNNNVLKPIREAHTGAKRIKLPGNHCTNIMAPNRISQKTRRCCDPRIHAPELKHWDWERYDYEFNPNRCCFRLGQVTFMHGFKANPRAHQNQHLIFAQDYGLLVCGHTHRPEPVTQVWVDGSGKLQRWFANPGTFIKIDPIPYYVKRQNHGEWGQGIVVGEAQLLKSPRAGRYWDAETIVRRMAWENKPNVRAI